MDIANVVARIRRVYHENMVSIVNAGNQLHLIKDEKAEEANMNHVMTLVNDIYPRIYGQEAIDKVLNNLFSN